MHHHEQLLSWNRLCNQLFLTFCLFTEAQIFEGSYFIFTIHNRNKINSSETETGLRSSNTFFFRESSNDLPITHGAEQCVRRSLIITTPISLHYLYVPASREPPDATATPVGDKHTETGIM